jgi:hypothetical protein
MPNGSKSCILKTNKIFNSNTLTHQNNGLLSSITQWIYYRRVSQARWKQMSINSVLYLGIFLYQVQNESTYLTTTISCLSSYFVAYFLFCFSCFKCYQSVVVVWGWES